MVRRRDDGLGASSLGSRWLAPVKLVDPSRYGYLVPERLLVPQSIPSEYGDPLDRVYFQRGAKVRWRGCIFSVFSNYFPNRPSTTSK